MVGLLVFLVLFAFLCCGAFCTLCVYVVAPFPRAFNSFS